MTRRTTAAADLWTPTDLVVFSYSTFMGLVALLWGWRWGAALWIAVGAAHAVVFALLWWLRRVPLRGFSWPGLVRDGYPLVLILFLYWELRHLALLFSNGYHDASVIAWEQAIFGEQLAMTLSERFPSPVVSEYLHLSYGFYWLLLPVVGGTLYVRRKIEGFRELVFTVVLVFSVCYVVFVFWPVEGPYYRFARPAPPLSEGLFRGIVDTVLQASSRGAAFPSSHVAVAVAALLVARRRYRPLFWSILPLVLGLVIGTVYGRFHYGIDAAAGIAVGVAGYLVAPRFFGLLARSSAGGQRHG
ncbi:MAG: phosphatase PAP2 family protein [Gemmatimonadetes bacterium]|nr:phosphatase PAP2 family protein [Gemmatimonadota bacterium]